MQAETEAEEYRGNAYVMPQALLDINLCEIFDISRGIRYVLTHSICSLWERDLYHIENEHSEFISNLMKLNISNTRSVYIDIGEFLWNKKIY